MRPFLSTIAIGAVALLGAGPASALAADGSRPPAPRQLVVSNKPWMGDFDRMLERRVIRVLVPYSRTLFYIDKGRERGMTAEIVREWERSLNQKYARQLGKRPLTVYLIPTTRDRLLPGVVEGLGDVAAGNITVTEQRLEIVDFAAPSDLRRVDEIVVAGPKAPAVESVDDLSGKTVHVRPATSHYQSLATLNERFAREGRAPVTLRLLPDALEVEDTLEMVNAGLLDLVIADDWVVRIWAQVLPNLKPVPAATLRDDGQIGWAIRKDSPKLQAALQDFFTTVARKQGLFGYLQAQATRRVKQFRNNTADDELRRFEELMGLFRTYGARYNFDPLMLAAQGYQESQLDQKAKSHVGAIGVMQLMPATGAQLKVGDIRVTEPNIHAGAKYLDQLMTKYFADANFSEGNRPLFAFASYNAGPANISRMRRLAAQRGLDPDRWFNHVELVTGEKIGVETTTYVRNIYKYYVAYKLTLEHMELQQKTKAQMRSGR
jgi:membrane-bound lytic murein transglycosylase MltF